MHKREFKENSVNKLLIIIIMVAMIYYVMHVHRIHYRRSSNRTVTATCNTSIRSQTTHERSIGLICGVSLRVTWIKIRNMNMKKSHTNNNDNNIRALVIIYYPSKSAICLIIAAFIF